MNLLRQITAVTMLNLRNLRSRFWPSLVIVIGMACVVGVLLSMLSLTTGYLASRMKAGDPGRAIVLSEGREDEDASSLTRDQAAMVMDQPGIRKDADGSPLAEGEILRGIPGTRKPDTLTFEWVRGFGPKSWLLRPELRLIAGRMIRPGAREVLVGKAAQGQFAGMEIGDKIIMPDGEWPIVGVFSTGGDILESELIVDRDVMMGAMRRDTFNSVLARLEAGPNSMDRFDAALKQNPALAVMAERHSTYFDHVSRPDARAFSAVAYTTGGILAIGAMFGALNLMYAAVGARTQEIGTLRALGFGALPVAVSVVSECLLLALIGALIGASLAWLLFNGSQTAYWQDVFDLKVTPGLIGLGLAWALVIALLGSLTPAIRAARLPIVEALRAS